MLKLFEIRKSQEKKFTKLMKDFNKVLVANGEKAITPIRIQDKEIECEHIFEDKILTFTVPGTVYSINIPDEVLALNGYTLIGNYHLNENIWWRETFTDNEEDKKEVNQKNFRCDHCKKNIGNRKGYYFFRDVENKLVVVGSTCVKKFFGLKTDILLKKLGAFHQLIDDVSDINYDNEKSFGFYTPSFSNDICFILTKYFTGDFSFWQKSDNDGNGTSNKVKRVLYGILAKKKEAYATYEAAQENWDKDDAKKIELARVYWLANKNNSDFDVNCAEIIKEGRFDIKYAGIASYGIFKAINFYKNQKSNLHNGDFVGQIKERITMTLTCTKMTSYEKESYYGWQCKCETGYRLQFKDDKGNVFVTFTTSYDAIQNAKNNLNKEALYRFTVIEHKTEKNGNKTNKINRLAFVGEN